MSALDLLAYVRLEKCWVGKADVGVGVRRLLEVDLDRRVNVLEVVVGVWWSFGRRVELALRAIWDLSENMMCGFMVYCCRCCETGNS